MRGDQPAALVGWPSRTVISRSPAQPDLEDRSIEDLARERGGPSRRPSARYQPANQF